MTLMKPITNPINTLSWPPKGLTEIALSGGDAMVLAKEFRQLLSLSSAVPLHWYQYADEIAASNENKLQCVVLDDKDGFHLLNWQTVDEAVPEISFGNWLTTINPENWDDLLMAVSTYNALRYAKGDSVNKTLKQLAQNNDLMLDAVLKSTRGLLLWRHQYVDLLRMCDMGISQSDGEKLIKNVIIMNRPDARKALTSVRLWSGQSYLDMVQERNPFKNPYGTPLPITKFNHTAIKLYPYLNCVKH